MSRFIFKYVLTICVHKYKWNFAVDIIFKRWRCWILQLARFSIGETPKINFKFSKQVFIWILEFPFLSLLIVFLFVHIDSNDKIYQMSAHEWSEVHDNF